MPICQHNGCERDGNRNCKVCGAPLCEGHAHLFVGVAFCEEDFTQTIGVPPVACTQCGSNKNVFARYIFTQGPDGKEQRIEVVGLCAACHHAPPAQLAPRATAAAVAPK